MEIASVDAQRFHGNWRKFPWKLPPWMHSVDKIIHYLNPHLAIEQAKLQSHSDWFSVLVKARN
jgi:hypothetical protein